MTFQLEICVDSITSAQAARAGGADRLEVCSSLAAGGTTPSEGLVRACVDLVGLPVMMMIRPRDGQFIYDEADLSIMLRDIEIAQRLGVSGVVFGALTAEGRIDHGQCERLLDAAEGLTTTFHRAFDVAREPIASLDTVIELGFDYLLTSGQQATAHAGAELIARLHERAAGRIAVVAGAGVGPENARQIMATTGVRELHASASEAAGPTSSGPVTFGSAHRVTSAAKVQAIRAACCSAG